MFGIYVNKASVAESGYSTQNGGISPWQRDAERFESMALAIDRIHALGYVLNAHVQRGIVTAYACRLLD